MGYLGESVWAKGRATAAKFPKSNMLRCFRSRKRRLVWSGAKERRVIEDEVREGGEATRSHRACKSL